MMRIVGIVLLVLFGAAYLFYLLLTNWMDGGTAAAITSVAVIAVLWLLVSRIRRGVQAGGAFLRNVLNGRR